MTAVIELEWSLSRTSDGAKCPACKGYAEKVEPTPEEDAKYGCGRRRCCSRAFVCGLCGARLVGKAEAPEME